MSSGAVIVPIRPGSDGDASHRPDRPAITLVDPPSIYLEKLGMLWMQHMGQALPGKFRPSSSITGLRRAYALHTSLD